jgi:diguanylate cyclase (GGDEF)-like protein
VSCGYALPSVYLAEGGRLRCYAAAGYWQIFDGVPLTAGVLGRTYRSGEPISVLAAEGFPYLTACTEVVEEVCVPIRLRADVVGVVNLESLEPMPASVPGRLTALADHLSEALQRLWSPQDESDVRRIAHHGIRLAEATSWGQAVERVLEAACSLSGMESAVLAVHSGSGWRVAGAGGRLGASIAGLAAEELAAIAEWVAPGTSCYTPGLGTGYSRPGSARLQGWGVRSLAVVPLDAAGARQGFLLTADERQHTSTTQEAERLELFGALAAGTLRTLDVLGELRHVAERDSLTGLLNHGRFREDLGDLLTHPRAARSTALMLIDLDRFKQVNDAEGHLVGDDVLRTTADVLLASLRADDRAYRIGGDEFAVLLQGVDGDGGHGIAARLHLRLRRTLEPRTVSLGVARARPGDEPDALVLRADAALYAAKRAGRDGFASAAQEANPSAAHEGFPPVEHPRRLERSRHGVATEVAADSALSRRR